MNIKLKKIGIGAIKIAKGIDSNLKKIEGSGRLQHMSKYTEELMARDTNTLSPDFDIFGGSRNYKRKKKR